MNKNELTYDTNQNTDQLDFSNPVFYNFSNNEELKDSPSNNKESENDDDSEDEESKDISNDKDLTTKEDPKPIEETKQGQMDTFIFITPKTMHEDTLNNITSSFTAETGSFLLQHNQQEVAAWEYGSIITLREHNKEKDTAALSDEEKKEYYQNFMAKWGRGVNISIFYFVRHIREIKPYQKIYEAASNILSSHLTKETTLSGPSFLIPQSWEIKQLDSLYFMSGKNLGHLIFKYLEKVYND